MWEFLGKVFEESGYTATLYLITLGACGFAMWKFWSKINGQAAEIRQLHGEIKTMGEAHAKQVGELVGSYSKQIENVQEKRISEAHAVREALLENQQTLLEAVSKVDQTWRGYLAGRSSR
jgi:hypothetical protein